MRSGYDSRTAVTFMMIGLGIGALLSLFLYPGREEKIPARKDIARPANLGRMSA